MQRNLLGDVGSGGDFAVVLCGGVAFGGEEEREDPSTALRVTRGEVSVLRTRSERPSDKRGASFGQEVSVLRTRDGRIW